jgi:hypothetical protein
LEFKVSKHAEKEIMQRKIPLSILQEVAVNPQQIINAGDNKKIYQSIVNFESDGQYLLRVIINDTVDPIVIVTAYRTSKISKYWSTL